MPTQNTRIRERLGAEIARIAERAGYTTQGALAVAAGLGLRTIVAVQRGEKVSARTMRKIENTLDLPTGQTDSFIAGEIHQLMPNTEPVTQQIYDPATGAVDKRAALKRLMNMIPDVRATFGEEQASALEDQILTMAADLKDAGDDPRERGQM